MTMTPQMKAYLEAAIAFAACVWIYLRYVAGQKPPRSRTW